MTTVYIVRWGLKIIEGEVEPTRTPRLVRYEHSYLLLVRDAFLTKQEAQQALLAKIRKKRLALKKQEKELDKAEAELADNVLSAEPPGTVMGGPK